MVLVQRRIWLRKLLWHRDVKYSPSRAPATTRRNSLRASLGVQWAGGSDEAAPVLLDAALLFAPVGALVPAALAALDKGGIVICGGIHMSAIPEFSYDLLWQERRICSVANLTRADATEFMTLAAKSPLQTRTPPYPLERANDALDDLRSGRLSGAAVLIPAWRPELPAASIPPLRFHH